MKKFIASLLLFGMLCVSTVSAHPRTRVTSAFLQEAFGHLNDGYFDGNLPRDTRVIYGGAPNDEEVIGATYCTYDPHGGISGCTIYIVPKYNLVAPQALETLIHETAHIATYGRDFDHGPIWQHEMLRLAEEGAFTGIW